jgi:hypothetical protein
MATTVSNSKKRPAPPAETAMMDSLPYVDVVHEDYEQYALALVEEEMKNSKAPDLPSKLPDINFRSVLMEKEYQRFVDTDGKPKLTKWNATNVATVPEDDDDMEAWQAAVGQARSEYEAERTRSMSLEARKDAGAVVLWKGFNEHLDKDLASRQEALHKQRELVEQINLKRSEDQQKDGKQLHILTDQYQSAVERRFQLQQAIVALEQEVKQLS